MINFLDFFKKFHTLWFFKTETNICCFVMNENIFCLNTLGLSLGNSLWAGCVAVIRSSHTHSHNSALGQCLYVCFTLYLEFNNPANSSTEIVWLRWSVVIILFRGMCDTVCNTPWQHLRTNITGLKQRENAFLGCFM